MPEPRALLATFQDSSGLVRARVVPAERLDALYAAGISVGRAAGLLLTFDDGVATVPGVDPLAGDLRAVADRDRTVMLDETERLFWTPLSLHERDGSPSASCPRSTLQRLVAQAADDHGLRFVTGAELEFTVLKPPAGHGDDIGYAHDGPAYGARAVVDLESFVLDLIASLAGAGVGLDCVHPEFAPGQFEVVLSPQDPVRTADDVVLTKLIVDRTARRRGLRPSFAPVIGADLAGNGCHTHLSAVGPSGNVFSDLDDPQRMTAEAEHLTAGLLDLLEPGAALLAGNTTSYVRLSPGRWAGGMICWGVRNREAALRFLPAEDLSSRHAANVELKTPDGLSNHYLVAAFALAAAMHGLEQRPALPEPVTGDPAQLDHAGKTRHQVRAFPSDLGEALQRLDASHTLRKLLGDELVDTYCAVRAAEWHQHRHEPLSAQIAATLLRY